MVTQHQDVEKHSTSIGPVSMVMHYYSSRFTCEPFCNVINLITDCQIETDMNYWNFDLIPTGEEPTQPTAEACRQYCECVFDAEFFTWGNGDQKCYCKSSNGNPGGEGGKFSGRARGCSGASEYCPHFKRSEVK